MHHFQIEEMEENKMFSLMHSAYAHTFIKLSHETVRFWQLMGGQWLPRM